MKKSARWFNSRSQQRVATKGSVSTVLSMSGSRSLDRKKVSPDGSPLFVEGFSKVGDGAVAE